MAFANARWPEQQHVGAPLNLLGALGQLLRKLGELPGARTDSPSLVARLGAFYSAMLKGRPERAFLRDEFIQFGAQEWGEGLVDARMLRARVGVGYALYYFASDDNRDWLAPLHWAVGLSVPLVIAFHVRRGRRRGVHPQTHIARRMESGHD